MGDSSRYKLRFHRTLSFICYVNCVHWFLECPVFAKPEMR
jgi:hypothetical protein